MPQMIGATPARGQIGSRAAPGGPIGPTTPAPEQPHRLAVAVTYATAAGRPQIGTGVVLGPRQILTAGHCGCGVPSSYQVFIEDDVVPGRQDGYRLAQSPILFDPGACRAPPGRGADLALLVLDEDLICAAAAGPGPKIVNGQPAPGDCRSDVARRAGTAPPVSFGYPAEPFWTLLQRLRQGLRLTVVGYGYTETGAIGARMQAEVPVHSAACLEPAVAEVCAPFAEMILAEAPGSGRRPDSCRGDSGGPVFLVENGGYTLVAVTSRAAPGTHMNAIGHCGGGGIYTVLSRISVQRWLAANGVAPAAPIAPIEPKAVPPNH
jgi:hypothetical protein